MYISKDHNRLHFLICFALFTGSSSHKEYSKWQTHSATSIFTGLPAPLCPSLHTITHPPVGPRHFQPPNPLIQTFHALLVLVLSVSGPSTWNKLPISL